MISTEQSAFVRSTREALKNLPRGKTVIKCRVGKEIVLTRINRKLYFYSLLNKSLEEGFVRQFLSLFHNFLNAYKSVGGSVNTLINNTLGVNEA